MNLKVVHTKDGRTLYKDLDTGHWVPKDKAESILSQIKAYNHNRAVKQDEDLKAEQIRKQQEQAKALNEQHTDPNKMNFKKLLSSDSEWTVYKDQKSGWTIEFENVYRSVGKAKILESTTVRIRDEKGNRISDAYSGLFGKEEGAFYQRVLQEATTKAEEFYKRRQDPEPYKDILGPKRNISSIEALTKCNKENTINPHYGDDLYKFRDKPKKYKEEYKKYHHNCALCSTAGILQAQGYDVEALQRDKDWRGPSTVFDVDYSNTDNFISNTSRYGSTGSVKAIESHYGDGNYILYKGQKITGVQVMPKGAKAVAKAIEDKVKGWGDGAVGEISVWWKNTGSRHSVLIINQNGNVSIFDGQCNEIRPDLEKFFSKTYAQRTYLVRYDNAPLKKDAADNLKKMVKKVDRSLNASFERAFKDVDWNKF